MLPPGTLVNAIRSAVAFVILPGCLASFLSLATPDEMRGRVTAVDMIFIGTSNEFGQFESGITAQWFGTVPAVVLGGIGTLVVVALWAWWFPELRNAGELHEFTAEPESTTADPA